MPWTIRVDHRPYEELEGALKQLNAPFGQFGMDTLNADTSAISTGSHSDDSTYTGMDWQLQACASARAALASQIQGVLQTAANGQAPVNHWEADRLTRAADALIGDVSGLAQDSTPPSSPACG
jgi:hypothetical protein